MAIALQRATVLARLSAHQGTLQEMGVKSLSLFGSVARDQAHSESDVDLLVEFSKPVGFFQFFKVKHYLEDLLECSIDLGTVAALKTHLRQPVMQDMIHVF